MTALAPVPWQSTCMVALHDGIRKARCISSRYAHTDHIHATVELVLLVYTIHNNMGMDRCALTQQIGLLLVVHDDHTSCKQCEDNLKTTIVEIT